MNITIVLVNWNRSIDTIKCISSIKNSNNLYFNIIVVDNNSNIEEKKILDSISDDCDIYYLNENTGYTGGNNFGIKIALNNGADYIFLLNNDTLVDKGAIRQLISTMEANPNIAILSPKINFYPNTNIIWSGAPKFNKLFLMGILSGYREKDVGQCDFFEYVDYVSGCAMMIRSSIFKRVSLLSDDFFAACEDLDFCFRVRQKGYEIAYDPQAIIFHIESASSGGSDAPQYVYYQTRNYLLFHKLWHENIFQLFISQVYYFLFVVKRSIYFIFTAKWRSLIGIIYGVRDHFLKRYGSRPYEILSNKFSSINSKD